MFITWEQRKVKNTFRITRGNVLAASKTSREKTSINKYPVYSSQTLNNGLMGYYNSYLFEDAITWTTDGANAGTVRFRQGKFYSTNVNGVLLSENGHANECVATALNSVAWKYVSHVGNPKLMNNVMGEIDINIPSNIHEQDKISEIISSLDNLITLHQRKQNGDFATYKRKKHSQILANSWEQRKAKELCSIGTGKSNTQDQVEDGPYPFYIRSDVPVRSNKYLYDCEAVITIGDGNIGKVFHYVNGKFDLHQRCYKMTDFNGVLGKYFYFYFSQKFYERAMKMTAKATVDSVRMEMISEMNIDYPSVLGEQQQIAEFLSKLNNLITLHQRKCFGISCVKCRGMNFFEIQKLANAWEQRKLWEYTVWDKKFNEVEAYKQSKTIKYPYLLADEFKAIEDNAGSVQLLSTGQYVGYTTIEKAGKYLCKGEVVTIPWGGTPNIKYFNGFFVTTDNRIATSSDKERLNNKYLYYYLNHMIAFIESIYRGASIKHPSMNDLLNMVIDIPAIKEQHKIIATLTQIDNLITLHQRKGEFKKSRLRPCQKTESQERITNAWEQRKLGDVFDYERPDAYIVTSDKYSDAYPTPVLTANKGFILGYTNEDRVCKKECIIFDDFTLDSKYVTFPFMVKSSAIKVLTAKNGYFLPFSYELLKATKLEILGHARHYISVVQPTKVLVPKEKEQTKIGECMQQLDNLITLHQRRVKNIQGEKYGKKRSIYGIILRLF